MNLVSRAALTSLDILYQNDRTIVYFDDVYVLILAFPPQIITTEMLKNQLLNQLFTTCNRNTMTWRIVAGPQGIGGAEQRLRRQRLTFSLSKNC